MKKIIGIDFDGTCVTDLYPYVGDNIGAASVLRELGDKNLLILYTVRDGKYLQDAVAFSYYVNPFLDYINYQWYNYLFILIFLSLLSNIPRKMQLSYIQLLIFPQ